MNNKPIKMASSESGSLRGQAPKPLVRFAQHHSRGLVAKCGTFSGAGFSIGRRCEGSHRMLLSLHSGQTHLCPFLVARSCSPPRSSTAYSMSLGIGALSSSQPAGHRLISTTELLQSCSTCRIKHSASDNVVGLVG